MTFLINTTKLLTILFLFGTSFPLFAESPKAKGLRIAQEVDQADTGFGDFTGSTKMTLTNKQGQSSVRLMRNRTLEGTTDGDKALIIFDNPRDVKGSAVLTWTHKDGPDDQWLFLPALKRVKRIASKNKSGPFMGSEFAYEDLASQEVEKYTYLFLRDDQLDGHACYVIERDPVDPNSGYSTQTVWIRKDRLTQEKVEFYDRKKSLLLITTSNTLRSSGEQILFSWSTTRKVKKLFLNGRIIHLQMASKKKTFIKVNSNELDNFLHQNIHHFTSIE